MAGVNAGSGGGVLAFEREQDGHSSAVGVRAGAAFDFDLSSVAFDELLRHKEADAGADAARGVEGVEDVGQLLGGDTGSGVLDREDNAAIRGDTLDRDGEGAA